MIGTTISHYNIISKLGEGGMGVVYKAEDIRLKRTVALKFLSHHITATEEERARFLQEAQAIATLNHPNVCTLYGLEEHDGQQFLEMEFVDGVTLRAHMQNRQLKVDDAIDYAIQIADALHEAHSKGIVHRDVKAENIMVNSRNQIKVMDFGLAKLKGAMKLTKASSTIGTLAYMAPEQIRGEEIDARSDIFSLGVVLYEMVTGRTPFRGEHDAAIMYSIMNEEPEPAQSVRAEIPAELSHLIENTLEKEPADRYQTADEVIRELRRIRKHSSRVSRSMISERPPERTHESIPPASAPTPQPVSPPSAPKRMAIWLKAVIGVAVVGVGFVVWLFVKPAPHLSDNMSFRPLNIPFRTIWYPSLSADGNWIAFPATNENNVTEIYFMNAAGGDPKALTNDSLFKYTADISPDGSQVAFSKRPSRSVGFGNSDLWVVSTLGGPQKKIADGGVGARWSPDGKSIAFLTGDDAGTTSDLAVVNADGSNRRVILRDSLPPAGSRVSADWSPDGKEIAWLRSFRGAEGVYQEIIIRDIASGGERQLTHDRKNIDEVTWTTAGFILFSSNRGGASNLWAVPEHGGEPLQITKGPGPDLSVRVSRDARRVLYLQQAQFGSIWVADAEGLHASEIVPADQSVRNPRFSPDGKLIAYVANDPDPIKAGTSLYVVDADGRDRHRLFQTDHFIKFLLWSPDGKSIAYDYADSVDNVVIVDAADQNHRTDVGTGLLDGWIDGGTALSIERGGSTWRVPLHGTPTKLSPDSLHYHFSRDGKHYLVHDISGGGKKWMIPKADGSLSQPLLDGRGMSLMPDGKTVAYSRNGAVWLLDPLNGKTWPYPWNATDAVRPDDVTNDRKHSLYVKDQIQAKLILIDNFAER